MRGRRTPRIARILRAAAAAALAVGVVVAAPLAASAEGPDDIIVTVPEGDGGSNPPAGGTPIVNAQLRWGMNAEAGGGAFAGGCNFLSAGRAGDAGGSRVWTVGDGLYRAQDGNVRIEKPTAAGGWTAASWQTKCLDPQGAVVTTASTASTSGNQVVIDGGTGAVRDGALQIAWSGSFTIAFYGGMTYWSVTDPVLTLDSAGNGRLMGTASGYGTSMEDMTQWRPIPGQTVVLAEIRGADTGAATGFVTVPAYLGVAVGGAGQVQPTAANSAYWGSFPQSFVDFHRATGQQGYWVTTGGVRDVAKPASAVYVSYDASEAVTVPVPPTGDVTGPAPSNPLRAAPPVSPVAAVAAAVAALPGLPASLPITTLPQREGLVPGISGSVSPVVAPLLVSAAALSAAIVSVLSLMRVLPWQSTKSAMR